MEWRLKCALSDIASDAQRKRELSRPPLNLLLNPDGNKINKPWDVDLDRLLKIFLDLITKSEFLDLRLCGLAALSSALIYRLKVETLFILDKIKEARMQRIDISGEYRSYLEMPFRQEVYSTSIEDLVSTLEAILEDIIRGRRKQQERANLLLEPAYTFEPDKFLNKISELVNEFRVKVLAEIRSKVTFLFSEFAFGKDPSGKSAVFHFLFVSRHGRHSKSGADGK